MSDPTGPPAFAPTAASGGGRRRAVGHLALAAGLLVVVATAILLFDPGPVLVGRSYIGRNGRPFLSWSFRTEAHGMTASPTSSKLLAGSSRPTRRGAAI